MNAWAALTAFLVTLTIVAGLVALLGFWGICWLKNQQSKNQLRAYIYTINHQLQEAGHAHQEAARGSRRFDRGHAVALSRVERTG